MKGLCLFYQKLTHWEHHETRPGVELEDGAKEIAHFASQLHSPLYSLHSCFICQHDGQLFSEDSSETAPDVSDSEYEGGWGVIRGKFLAINAASRSCACPRSPKGLSPAAHLADGTTDLILVRKYSRFNFLRHLLRHTSKDDQL